MKNHIAPEGKPKKQGKSPGRRPAESDLIAKLISAMQAFSPIARELVMCLIDISVLLIGTAWIVEHTYKILINA